MSNYWSPTPHRGGSGFYSSQYPYYSGSQIYSPSAYTDRPLLSNTLATGGPALAASNRWAKLNVNLGSGETNVRFDIRKPPRESMAPHMYEFFGRQPALLTTTPATHMRLYSKNMPWSIEIVSKQNITCRDIWHAVYEAMNVDMDDSEWGLIIIDKKIREAVEKAAKKRIENLKPSPATGKVSKRYKRLDFLCDNTTFKGMEKDDEVLKLRPLPGIESTCSEIWCITFAP